MLNKVMLIGNLGADPELKTTPSGTPVGTFSVACNRKWKTSDGELKEETTWVRVEAWARLAEVSCEYLSKGSKVFVEGRLTVQSWEDRETGDKRYRTFVTAEKVSFLSGRGGDAPSSRSGGGDGFDDDIPF